MRGMSTHGDGEEAAALSGVVAGACLYTDKVEMATGKGRKGRGGRVVKSGWCLRRRGWRA